MSFSAVAIIYFFFLFLGSIFHKNKYTIKILAQKKKIKHLYYSQNQFHLGKLFSCISTSIFYTWFVFTTNLESKKIYIYLKVTNGSKSLYIYIFFHSNFNLFDFTVLVANKRKIHEQKSTLENTNWLTLYSLKNFNLNWKKKLN